MVLSACYGIVAPTKRIAGKLVFKSKSNNNISNLDISYQIRYSPNDEYWIEAGKSDSNGEFEYSYNLTEDESLFLKIEDNDGADNFGDFKIKNITPGIEDEETIIVMEEKTL